jgi:hypothetical protein
MDRQNGVNHIIEDMLRHYVNVMYDNWDRFLAMVELAYNDCLARVCSLFVLNTN